MIQDYQDAHHPSYMLGIKLETLSPVVQGVTEAVALPGGPKEVKVRKVRSVATILSAKELGYDKPVVEPERVKPEDGETPKAPIPTPEEEPSAFRSVVIDVPVLGANALRHKMRAILADHLLAVCGLTVRDFGFAEDKQRRKNYHVLYSGGGLTKGEKPLAGFWSAATIDRIYREWPILSLFGASYGGNMLQGKLSVSQGYPLVEKLIPHYFYTAENAAKLFARSAWIDVHPASLIRGRNGSHLDELWAEYRHPDNRVPMEGVTDDQGKTSKAETREMIMQSQYVPAGVPFGVVLQLENATPLEASALRYILEQWNALGVITFGGKTQSGMGHVSVQASTYQLPESELYEEYVEAHADALRRCLLAEKPWQSGLLAVSLTEAEPEAPKGRARHAAEAAE